MPTASAARMLHQNPDKRLSKIARAKDRKNRSIYQGG